MYRFMTRFDRSENRVIFAFDIRTVRMKCVRELKLLEDSLARYDVVGNGNANTQRHDAEINVYVHDEILLLVE